MAAANSNCN